MKILISDCKIYEIQNKELDWITGSCAGKCQTISVPGIICCKSMTIWLSAIYICEESNHDRHCASVAEANCFIVRRFVSWMYFFNFLCAYERFQFDKLIRLTPALKCFVDCI